MALHIIHYACMLIVAGGHQDTSQGVKDTDPSSNSMVGVRRGVTKDERDDKEGRLRRMEERRLNWLNRRMVRELVMELVENTTLRTWWSRRSWRRP